MPVIQNNHRHQSKNADVLSALDQLLAQFGPMPYWNDVQPPDTLALRLLELLGAPLPAAARLELPRGLAPVAEHYSLPKRLQAQAALANLRTAIARAGEYPSEAQRTFIRRLAQQLAPEILKAFPEYGGDWQRMLRAEQRRWMHFFQQYPLMAAPDRYAAYSDEDLNQAMKEWAETRWRLDKAAKSKGEKTK